MQANSIRILRRRIAHILASPDWEHRWKVVQAEHPASKLISPLVSALFSVRDQEHWHAVTCLGDVAEELAAENLESARVVMRRLMWSLNDESGGIGWGAPEAMGEIMARHQGLAKEYCRILNSYVLPRNGPDNYLEYPPLRQGAYWGLARLAQARPHLLQPAPWGQLLDSEQDPKIRIYICLILQEHEGSVPPVLEDRLRGLARKAERVRIYWDKRFQYLSLAELVPNLLAEHSGPESN